MTSRALQNFGMATIVFGGLLYLLLDINFPDIKFIEVILVVSIFFGLALIFNSRG